MKYAESLFDGEGVRPSAQKVLVIFTDKKSGLDENNLRNAADDLKEKAVEVIAVLIGDDSDVNEMTFITPRKDNIIEVPLNENPGELAKDVMVRVFSGMFLTL